ncbi:MAG: hypothetical protein SVM80_05235, partial [Halobacteriota archaeon]|nr:hypothetical protein [Halobacteriota archaeon]
MSGPKDSKLDEKIEELDALFEKIEKLVEEGATEEAIALSKKASMISKELKREETEEVIQVGAGEFGDLKDSEILSERKGALSEVKSLVKGGSTEEAIKRIELAAKLTDEMKERNTRANLESERKEVLGEVKSLVKGGSTEEAIKRIELAAKLTDRMKRRPSPSVASESIKIEYPPKIKEELEKPEIIPAPMKREPPITDVGLAKKIIAASFSPHKDIRYVTDNPFIEEAVLIVGICSILVATGGVLSGATITVNETITSIVYVFILWVAIAGASHMIST